MVLYTSRTLDNRTGHYVNHAHGHVLDSVLTALALTVCCSIIVVIMVGSRSGDPHA